VLRRFLYIGAIVADGWKAAIGLNDQKNTILMQFVRSIPGRTRYTVFMKVSIDVSPAVNGKAGLGRYAKTLAEALHEAHPGQVQLFANLGNSGRFPQELHMIPRSTVKLGYKGWRMAVFAGQILQMDYARFIPPGTQVFHATEHLLTPVRNIPSILTVHDLIYKLLPEHHKRLNYWYLNSAMPIFVKRAAHIIAVSESTRQDLIRHYGTPGENISVIYEAAAPHFAPQLPDVIEAVRKKYNLPDNYLVTVGTIEPRKNLDRLVEVLSHLRRDDPMLHLVVVGADGWLTEGFYDAIARESAGDWVIRPGYIPDADLPAVICGAVCSVTASLYEGFGLPVLEAMSCGVPVACSETSSLGEIAADAALTFDPESVSDMVQAIRDILQDETLRQDLSKRGLERSREFSWKKTAQETWAVYERTAASRSA